MSQVSFSETSLNDIPITINTHAELYKYTQSIKTSSKSLNVLALDIDHTLIVSTSMCASDHFNDFMTERNKDNKMDDNAHAALLLSLRNEVSFMACEGSEQINKIIALYKSNGWEVIALSARPTNMLHRTIEHIKHSGITAFAEEDIVLGSGDKPAMFRGWLERRVKNWEKIEELDVVFIDDRWGHCKSMINLTTPEKTRWISVTSLYYDHFQVSGKLTIKQAERLAVQFFAYKKGETIPRDEDIEQSNVQKALDGLELPALADDSTHKKLYEAICVIARDKGTPIEKSNNSAPSKPSCKGCQVDKVIECARPLLNVSIKLCQSAFNKLRDTFIKVAAEAIYIGGPIIN